MNSYRDENVKAALRKVQNRYSASFKLYTDRAWYGDELRFVRPIVFNIAPGSTWKDLVDGRYVQCYSPIFGDISAKYSVQFELVRNIDDWLGFCTVRAVGYVDGQAVSSDPVGDSVSGRAVTIDQTIDLADRYYSYLRDGEPEE